MWFAVVTPIGTCRVRWSEHDTKMWLQSHAIGLQAGSWWRQRGAGGSAHAGVEPGKR